VDYARGKAAPGRRRKVATPPPNTSVDHPCQAISTGRGGLGTAGSVPVEDGATKAKINVRCEALILGRGVALRHLFPTARSEEETALPSATTSDTGVRESRRARSLLHEEQRRGT